MIKGKSEAEAESNEWQVSYWGLKSLSLHYQNHLFLLLPFKRHTAATAALHCRQHHPISLDACQPCPSVLCPKAVVGGEEPVKGSTAEGEISEGVPLLVTFEVVEDELEQLER